MYRIPIRNYVLTRVKIGILFKEAPVCLGVLFQNPTTVVWKSLFFEEFV